jgi:hypothetical protein
MNPFGHITRVSLDGMSGFTLCKFAILIEFAFIILAYGYRWFAIYVDPMF